MAQLARPTFGAQPTNALYRERKRVLVVDDDATTSDLLLMVLEDEGYAAEGAPDGQRALALAAEGTPPALILLDVRMPFMDGWAFLRAYRERYPRPVPVIVVTAQAVNAA